MCVLCVDEEKVEGYKSTILSLLKFKNSRFSKDSVKEKLASLSIPKLLPQILFFSLRRCTVLQNFVSVRGNLQREACNKATTSSAYARVF
jgi:hypothetical protein